MYRPLEFTTARIELGRRLRYAYEDGALKEINGRLTKAGQDPCLPRRYIRLPKFLIDLLALVMSSQGHVHVFVGG